MAKMLGKASAWRYRCYPCCMPRCLKQSRKREWRFIEKRQWMKEMAHE